MKSKRAPKFIEVGILIAYLNFFLLPFNYSRRGLSFSSFTNKRAFTLKDKHFLSAGFIYNFLFSKKKVRIKRNQEGGYSLIVKGKPFFIQGIIYNPTPIGEGYDYDLSLDKTNPWLYDGKLMKEMGINCVRIYTVGVNLKATKRFIRDLYENFGIYTIVGDWLGLWERSGSNYADKEFRRKIKERMLKIVKELKDEEGILMWVLGNENNYTFSGKISFWTTDKIEKLPTPYDKIKKRARIYYSFVDEVAREIKKIDRNHPVALGNGELTNLDIAKQVCKNIDILAIISYRGKTFGNLFENIRYIFDKPVLISEYGCDSYDAERNKEAQDIQAEYLISQWKEILGNSPYGGNKKGNCLGGTIFEWSDEWWKHNEGYTPDWSKHNTEAGWSNGSYYFDIRAKDNLNMNEEWFGIVSLSKEKIKGINRRIPKKAFYALKKLFTSN